MTQNQVMQKDAEDFFAQLSIFSGRVLQKFGLPPAGSPHGDACWPMHVDRASAPIGAALHWTASDSIVGTLQWFCDPQSKVSAHVVVSDRKLAWAEHFAGTDCPLVAALPATAILCRPITKTAWHVRDMNALLLGIENQNAGEISGKDNAQIFSMREMKCTYRSDKATLSSFGKRYEPYTCAQVQTDVDILTYANAYFGNRLKKSFVLGHSCYQCERTNTPAEDKTDPGPLLPIADIRDAVFSPKGAGIKPETVGAAYALGWRAQIARQAMAEFRAQEKVYSQRALEEITQLQDAAAWDMFVRSCATTKLMAQYPVLGLGAMAILGFDCNLSAARGENDDSIRLCQRLFGLRVDGVIGGKTASAISWRLRGLLVD